MICKPVFAPGDRKDIVLVTVLQYLFGQCQQLLVMLANVALKYRIGPPTEQQVDDILERSRKG